MLGHTDVRAAMMYSDCIPNKTAKEVKSPSDFYFFCCEEIIKTGADFAFLVNNTIVCINWAIPFR